MAMCLINQPSMQFSAVILSLFLPTFESLQCLNGHGKPVDWYAVYKSPEVRSPKGWRFQEGLSYFYLDVNTPQWTLADQAINETDTAIYNTLQQIYGGKSNSTMYLMYNDEHPEEKSQLCSNERGHTKGVVAFDGKQGFWLIHSCPKFPPGKSQGYEWRTKVYGQNMICITFPYKQLDYIATQLLFNEPSVYDSLLPEQFAKDFPDLSRVIQCGHPKGPPWSKVVTLTSSGGERFVSFAKSGKFGADLYDALVAPTLKSDLLVETWLRTSGTKLDSNCTTKYKVMRVNAISLLKKVIFRETKDHAKWAVTYSSKTSNMLPWVCIGDINRMESQFHRGGGTICLNNTSVWNSYRSSVTKFDKCP